MTNIKNNEANTLIKDSTKAKSELAFYDKSAMQADIRATKINKNYVYVPIEKSLKRSDLIFTTLLAKINQVQEDALNKGQRYWALQEKDLKLYAWLACAKFLSDVKINAFDYNSSSTATITKDGYEVSEEFHSLVNEIGISAFVRAVEQISKCKEDTLCGELADIFNAYQIHFLPSDYVHADEVCDDEKLENQVKFNAIKNFHISAITDVLFDFLVKEVGTKGWLMNRDKSDLTSEFKTAVFLF